MNRVTKMARRLWGLLWPTAPTALNLPVPSQAVRDQWRQRVPGQPLTPIVRTELASGRADSRNVSGDFWVEAQCCLLCGVPWDVAPDLFDYDSRSCWVKRQPVTDDERRRMIRVLDTQELGCIHYSGSDPQLLQLTNASRRIEG
jgi:hypothetical protein